MDTRKTEEENFAAKEIRLLGIEATVNMLEEKIFELKNELNRYLNDSEETVEITGE